MAGSERRTIGAAQGRLPRLVGGALCLDFANTVGGRGGDPPDEYLFGYADLVAWGQYVGMLSEDQAARLRATAERRPEEAAEVFGTALRLRDTLYRAFSAAARGEVPRRTDLDALGRAYGEAMAHARLAPSDGQIGWSWAEHSGALARVLWPVARSAVELLTSDALGRVKECPGATGPCTWLFVDTSKNAVRRWCSMAEGCGGVAKARRRTARRQHSRPLNHPDYAGDVTRAMQA
jgi:predicted RNA-binding Zn ribbon-like protein